MPEDDNPAIRCAHCGERIGVYELLRVEQPDGTVGSSSYLNLTPIELHRSPRVWHWQCFDDGQTEPF
jgi:hypothetical protein